MKNLKFIVFVLLLFPAFAYAQGGPPMVTDDPGTPGDRHWEINVVGLLATTDVQNVLQLPYFDINYGLGERLQLKVEGGLVSSSGSAVVDSGAGTMLIGMKYRFLDESTSGVAISTYPQVQFRHFFSSHDPEIASPGNQYVLPFEFSKTFGNWEINPEIGFLYGTVVANEFLYGLVFAFEGVKPLEPLAEVHVNTSVDGTGSTTLLNLGLRYTFTPAVNLLAAAGHTVTHVASALLEFDAYFGLQFEC